MCKYIEYDRNSYVCTTVQIRKKSLNMSQFKMLRYLILNLSVTRVSRFLLWVLCLISMQKCTLIYMQALPQFTVTWHRYLVINWFPSKAEKWEKHVRSEHEHYALVLAAKKEENKMYGKMGKNCWEWGMLPSSSCYLCLGVRTSKSCTFAWISRKNKHRLASLLPNAMNEIERRGRECDRGSMKERKTKIDQKK